MSDPSGRQGITTWPPNAVFPSALAEKAGAAMQVAVMVGPVVVRKLVFFNGLTEAEGAISFFDGKR
jgi:hypothetical protein